MEKEQIARDEAVLDVSKRLIEQNQQAYEDLAGGVQFQRVWKMFKYRVEDRCSCASGCVQFQRSLNLNISRQKLAR